MLFKGFPVLIIKSIRLDFIQYNTARNIKFPNMTPTQVSTPNLTKDTNIFF